MSKKPPLTFTSNEVLTILDSQLSKAALADLVVDLLRRSEGNEALDGPELAKALRAAVAPVLNARGDRPLKTDADRRCDACRTTPWICRKCKRRVCEHYCSLKTSDGLATCGRCKMISAGAFTEE